jgi:hypothetical protein
MPLEDFVNYLEEQNSGGPGVTREIKLRALAVLTNGRIGWVNYSPKTASPIWNQADVSVKQGGNVKEWIARDMQSLGVLDKNGREIFEGDIVIYTQRVYAGTDNPEIFEGYSLQRGPEVIKFKSGEFWPRPWQIKYGEVITIVLSEFEVIGDMYNHPELLRIEL